MLPSCLLAEPQEGSQSSVPCLRPPLCVSHQLEVAFICFNLTALAHPGSAATSLSFLPLGDGCRVLCNKALSPHHL